MAVIVVNRKPRDNNMIEVTLAQDGTQLIVHVPASVDEDPYALVTYQKMMDGHLRSIAPILDAIERNKGV